MSHRFLRLAAGLGSLAGLAVALGAAPARADEGMWTFDNFPIETVNTKYGARIDQAWLDRVRGAAVRINGCSGSVVSGQGLVLTNAHCVLSCVQALSTAGEDHVQTGWMPATREDERTCPGQKAEILIDIVDVTDQIAAAGEGLEGAAFLQARGAVETALTQEHCQDDPQLSCQVISFYRGGRYALYKYQRYADVRLAFSPEHQAAYFGGDPDNFNFPRYSLDFGFLRLYQDGRPVETPGHLTWNPNAPAAGELTFVAGSPATTSRLLTVAQLERLRDLQLPAQLLQIAELRGRLIQYSAGGEEQGRVALDALSGLENNFKAYYGQHQALLDPGFMATRRELEETLKAQVAADPELAARIGDPWAELEQVQATAAALLPSYRQLEQTAGQGSHLYAYARTIVRMATERSKPEDERRSGYGEAAMAAASRSIAAPMPIDDDLERIRLGFWLSKTREYMGVDNPHVRGLLGDESPEALAERLVDETGLGDPEFRAELLTLTLEELAQQGDPFIDFILASDASAQLARAQWEAAVAAPTARAAERIAQARFAVHGDDQYPDATYSLRLSYGQVKGWTWRRTTVPPFTRIAGLYDRATGSAPFDLSPRWIAARDRLNPDTAFAYVTTNDIAGGNSGSPVLNARGEVIGAAFDGNIHSLGGAFGYDGAVNRTVVISTAVITEALRHVYDQPRLLSELGVR